MKTIKKVLLSSVSVLGISFLTYLILLLNPNLSYANHTQFDNVTIYHNQELEDGVEAIINDAVSIIKTADIFDEGINIQFCLNDDKVYPKLNPFAGATAYAFLDKAVMYASKPNFTENVAEFKWEVNNFEVRKYNLTRLLAHEFMHNVQNNNNLSYVVNTTLGKLNWKLEGHAEYIAREFKGDGQLKDKIARYLIEEKKDHIGEPVFLLADGTIQNLWYFKNALVIQYLMEIKELNYDQICKIETSVEELYSEMIVWSTII